MSENINFISAADLPEAEGNDLTFLCLENGEMKQTTAPGNHDVIILVEELLDDDGYYIGEDLTLEKGDYSEVLAKLKAHELVSVAVHGAVTYGEEYPFSDTGANIIIYNDLLEIKFRPAGWNYQIYLFPDNSLSYDETPASAAVLSVDEAEAAKPSKASPGRIS